MVSSDDDSSVASIYGLMSRGPVQQQLQKWKVNAVGADSVLDKRFRLERALRGKNPKISAEEAAMAARFIEPASELTRYQITQQLKEWKLRAMGKLDELQQRYDEERARRGLDGPRPVNLKAPPEVLDDLKKAASCQPYPGAYKPINVTSKPVKVEDKSVKVEDKPVIELDQNHASAQQVDDDDKSGGVKVSFVQPSSALNRQELQHQLRQWNLPAMGTTRALCKRYDEERVKRGLDGAASEATEGLPAAISSLHVANDNHAVQEEFKSPVRVTSADKQSTATMSGGNKKKAAKTPENGEEKRQVPYRSSPPAGVQDRINRALTQRLYLISKEEVTEDLTCTFAVLGSTGNVYDVKIARKATCSCPDNRRRGGGTLCKHILFVLLKVINLPADSPLIYQGAWITSELKEIFALLNHRRVGGGVEASERVRNTYARLKAGKPLDDDEEEKEQEAETLDDVGDGKVRRKSLDEDSDCPICFESLKDCNEPLTFCRAACGSNFHAACIKRWGSTTGYYGGQKTTITCPNCRQPWQDETALPQKPGVSKKRGAVANFEGYTNMGVLQGQSLVRDTSTYSSSYHYNKRRR